MSSGRERGPEPRIHALPFGRPYPAVQLLHGCDLRGCQTPVVLGFTTEQHRRIESTRRRFGHNAVLDTSRASHAATTAASIAAYLETERRRSGRRWRGGWSRTAQARPGLQKHVTLSIATTIVRTVRQRRRWSPVHHDAPNLYEEAGVCSYSQPMLPAAAKTGISMNFNRFPLMM